MGKLKFVKEFLFLDDTKKSEIKDLLYFNILL